jgi:cytochrome c5
LKTRIPLLLPIAALLVACAACGGASSPPAIASSSPELQADYEVFSVRCSKCHSLARPLSSGIDDDDYWKAYVAKMRRQPGSGISAEDSVAILRFLHLYAADSRRRKARTLDAASGPGAP